MQCVIEIDGSIHDSQLGYDDRRDEWLHVKHQVTVIRFKNDDVGAEGFKMAMWNLAEKFFKQRIEAINLVASELNFPKYPL